MSEWSKSEPSPSGVFFSVSRNFVKSSTWYVLIFTTFAMFAGSLPWCETVWCCSPTPIWGYVRWLSSRSLMNVKTRVRSPRYASVSRSYISARCSSNASGTPAGRATDVMAALLRASDRSMRRSISRTFSR